MLFTEHDRLVFIEENFALGLNTQTMACGFGPYIH